MNRIKLLRGERSLSTRQVEALIGISYMNINHYENEKRDPSTAALKKMATFFEVTIDYLLGFSNAFIYLFYEDGLFYYKVNEETYRYLFEEGDIYFNNKGNRCIDFNKLIGLEGIVSFNKDDDSGDRKNSASIPNDEKEGKDLKSATILKGSKNLTIDKSIVVSNNPIIDGSTYGQNREDFKDYHNISVLVIELTKAYLYNKLLMKDKVSLDDIKEIESGGIVELDGGLVEMIREAIRG